MLFISRKFFVFGYLRGTEALESMLSLCNLALPEPALTCEWIANCDQSKFSRSVVFLLSFWSRRGADHSVSPVSLSLCSFIGTRLLSVLVVAIQVCFLRRPIWLTRFPSLSQRLLAALGSSDPLALFLGRLL